MHTAVRAGARITEVARTIADLEGGERVMVHHVAAAVRYRTLDRKLWA